MMYLLLICQLILAFVLLLAATGKLLNSAQFVAVLRLSHLPKLFVVPIAVGTPLVEAYLALGLLLSTPHSLPLLMLATVIVFSAFTIWMLTVSLRGLRLRCGCFGAGAARIGPRTILRNIFLMAVSVVGLVLSTHVQSPLPLPSFWMTITVCSCGMCLILLRAFQQGKHALILSLAQLESSQASNAKW
jgi:hypothetical protein